MSISKQSQIGILGAGAWGTAMAKIIADKGYTVDLWCYEQDLANHINQKHENYLYLKRIALSKNIVANTDLKKVCSDKDFILIAIPSPYIIDSIKKILDVENIREGLSNIGVLTKGFIATSRGTKLIIETLENYLPGIYKNNLVYITGPSHAEEVAEGKITGLISASANGKNTIKFRKLLSGNNLIVFSSFDIIGVQVCAALKNVIAIAFGILDALKEKSGLFGDNTESLLLAAGLNEIQKLGQALGSSHPETFTSIAGVGDLDVTCRSVYGRNRRFGREIVLNNLIDKYANIDDLIDNIMDIGYLPEGIYTAKRVYELAKQYKLKLPVSTHVYRILNRSIEPYKAVEHIMKWIYKGSKL